MIDYRDALADISLKRGSILHSLELFKDSVGHGKFFVIMGEDDKSYKGFFYINSRIHESLHRNEELLKLQYVIDKKDYPFLNYYSYINCSSLMEIPKQTLREGIKAGTITFIGQLLESDEDAILKSVRESDIYSAKQKKTYFK